MKHIFTPALAATKGSRSYQEDAAALWPGPAAEAEPFTREPENDGLVVILADGMGGHAGGALASRTVCKSFLTAHAQEVAPIRDRLRQGMTSANRAVAIEVDANRAMSGMGSTLVGVAFGPEGMEWVQAV